MSSYAENLRELAAKGMMNTTVLRGAANELAAERALADDLAAVLTNHTDHGFPGHPEILRVLARYREARQQ